MSVSRVKIRLVILNFGVAEGELMRHRAPRTVDALVKSLPLEGRAALWKEEVYFSIPLKMGNEKPASKVQKGTIAYWPQGTAFCIFYGDSQPYSPVNVLGQVTTNLDLFRQVKSGTTIKVEMV